MLGVIFTSRVQKENQAEFLTVACRHAKISREQDKGCIRFDVLSPTQDSEEIKFIEIWESEDCLNAHSLRSKEGKEAPLLNALRYGKEMLKYEIIG